MPTILRIGPYRFFFYSADVVEPAHIHIQRDDNVAKFWLDPVTLAQSGGFRGAELRMIRRHVEQHTSTFSDAFYAFRDQT